MPQIRRATLADLDALVGLRCALMEEISAVAAEAVPALAEATRRYLATDLPTEQFCAWVACDDTGAIIASSGLVFTQKPPSPGNLSGREAYVMNIYTAPTWRGRGVAADLLAIVLAFVRERGVTLVRLHATAQGRAIYERAGFASVGNEMVAQL